MKTLKTLAMGAGFYTVVHGTIWFFYSYEYVVSGAMQRAGW